MFGKKKPEIKIDKDQLELIENAQKRIRQKKWLYIHFVVFLIGTILLIISNTLLGIGKEYTLFGKAWFLYAILLWTFFFLYHVFNVFITNKFMGKPWEKRQLEKLVAKQQERIEKLKANFIKDESAAVKNELTNTQKTSNKKPEITIIAAAAKNNAIGKDNKLIWHLSDDLKRFKNLTNGHFIIMGRKTFESFPKPLPNRTHVVITRQENYTVPDGVIVVNNLDDALDAAKNDSQPFIIGGGEIYNQAMAIADKIELTRVHENFDADTYFPNIDTTIWKEMAHTLHDKDENNDYKYSFITYKRI
ncbi:dihydrofolate reductase [Aestuariivivens marinum]|uniref:dihydrofolate reductase n=1 Tax=Aestuariivivens marinum TaxID=2913555 RepID=UPI001F56CFCA|nr:dihydrofolate reductase [Aestuariivivens marinum]